MEELVPAETPEFDDRSGRPGAVGERWPGPLGLSEEDATDERGDVVKPVHGRVYHHGGAGAEKGCQGEDGTPHRFWQRR
jgi:hypothetical protein